IPHGHAIGMGLKYLFKVMGDKESLSHWDKLVKALSLPPEKFDLSSYDQFDLKTFLSYLDQDKKKIENKLRLILVNGIGSCYVESVPMKELKAKIQTHDEFKNF